MKTDFLLPFFISPLSLDLFLKKIINYKNRKIPFCGQSCVPYSFFVDGTGTHPTLKDICVFGFRRFPEVPFFFSLSRFSLGSPSLCGVSGITTDNYGSLWGCCSLASPDFSFKKRKKVKQK
jgi:hypothetical protein